MGKRCRAVGRDGAAWRLAKGWRCRPGGFGGRGCGRRCRPAVGSGADIASRPRLALACSSKKTYMYTPFFLHVHAVKTTCTSRKTCMYIQENLHVHPVRATCTCSDDPPASPFHSGAWESSRRAWERCQLPRGVGSASARVGRRQVLRAAGGRACGVNGCLEARGAGGRVLPCSRVCL